MKTHSIQRWLWDYQSFGHLWGSWAVISMDKGTAETPRSLLPESTCFSVTLLCQGFNTVPGTKEIPVITITAME